MKRLFSLFIIFLLSAIAFIFSGCNDDDSFKANVRFTNSDDSEGTINSILYQDNDVTNTTWERGEGYAIGVTTEFKEVTSSNGTIECALEVGGQNVESVEVLIEEVNSSSISPDADEDNSYTLRATES